jgi:signal transduction histidine kinase
MSPPDQAPTLAARLRHLAETDPSLGAYLITCQPGDILLTEGAPNDSLYVLIQGEVTLLKTHPDSPSPVAVSTLTAGDLLGVNSIATRQPSFSTGRAATALRCLRLDATALANLSALHPEFHGLLQQLITANLGDRYRSAVQLQLHLTLANQELTETRNQLIHQEKMAVLGQLVAGLAHELNNPAAALARQRDHLETILATWLGPDAPPADLTLWHAGRLAVAVGSPEARAQLDRLETAHPSLPRALLRRLAAVPAPHWPLLLPPSGADTLPPESVRRLAIFEAAHLLHSQQIATAQISHLVAGLKNYSRPSGEKPTLVNLRENIEQVLVILAHGLKHTPLETDLDPTLAVIGRPGDLNQVWTNLIRNALEAAGPHSPLRITARRGAPHEAIVSVIDRGPGIPAGLHARIFDLNYTSKTGRENFGLGLGLAISLSLVTAHGGRIETADTPGGGATFTIHLPAAPA